jgi:carboxymethylenebutenolidase
MLAVVNIRGDRLYHEHISWDHASALRQVGVLPETLPLTVEVPVRYQEEEEEKEEEKVAPKTKHYEITLPVTGTDTARKMRDKNSVVSNAMFEYQAREL